jgi:hypothetical protein
MSAHLSAFRSFLAALPPRSLSKRNDTGDTGDTGPQVAHVSGKVLYHPAESHGDTGDTRSAHILRGEGVVSPVSPARIESDTEKSPQLQKRITGITGITGRTAVAEQIAEWCAAIEGVTSELPDVVRLKEVSLRFLGDPEAGTAIENGWDAVSLFGMNGGERLERQDLAYQKLLALGFESAFYARFGKHLDR